MDGAARAARRRRVELAGSARRMADTCKDLDVVAATADPRGRSCGAFARAAEIDEVHSLGRGRARAR